MRLVASPDGVLFRLPSSAAVVGIWARDSPFCADLGAGEGVQVGSSVSEVMAAFVTTFPTPLTAGAAREQVINVPIVATS